MTLSHRGHSYYVFRVVYDLTKRSFILRSLYKQKSVLLYFLWLLLLWSPYVIGQNIVFSSCGFFMVALCNRADHIYFHPVVCYGRPA